MYEILFHVALASGQSHLILTLHLSTQFIIFQNKTRKPQIKLAYDTM